VMQAVYQNLDAVIAASLSSTVLLLLLRPLAIKASFVDTPNDRKTHQGQIPLTGGISTFFSSFLIFWIFFDTFTLGLNVLLICSGLFLLLGALDDKFDLRASTKLFLQAAIAMAFIISTGFHVTNLGSPFGFSGSLGLATLSIPFTLLAIVGLVNAINMIDGCDGLAASLVIVSLLALLILGPEGLSHPTQHFLLAVTASLVAFLFFNFSKNESLKTFLGDGGSLFLGFVVAASLVEFSASNTLYDPSIVLWFAALPIFDFCTVIARRMLLKRKIMAADRSHLHHLLLSWRLSHFQTTTLIFLAAVAVLLFGVFVTSNHSSLSFWSFLALFILYLSIRMLLVRDK
jgi:UDP-GlcNAc:undecaprenyl-phosphate GlcNAc-1-phosphate transferase